MYSVEAFFETFFVAPSIMESSTVWSFFDMYWNERSKFSKENSIFQIKNKTSDKFKCQKPKLVHFFRLIIIPTHDFAIS